MPQPPTRKRSPVRTPQAQPATARDWFLRDSHWDDMHWVLAPTTVLHEDRPVVLRWDFTLPNGRAFTHRQYATLLESARQHLALFRVKATRFRSGCSGGSLGLYFQCLRTLIRWMIQERFQRFADLDATGIADFTRAIRRRRGYTGPTIARETLSHYYTVLAGLYRHRSTVSDALQIDPFPGLSVRGATPRTHDRPPAPYTPDIVAIPLIQGAIEFLSTAALPILTARERCLQEYQRRRTPGDERRSARLAALAALHDITIDTPRGLHRLDSYRSLTSLIELLYVRASSLFPTWSDPASARFCVSAPAACSPWRTLARPPRRASPRLSGRSTRLSPTTVVATSGLHRPQHFMPLPSSRLSQHPTATARVATICGSARVFDTSPSTSGFLIAR